MVVRCHETHFEACIFSQEQLKETACGPSDSREALNSLYKREPWLRIGQQPS